MILDLDVHRFEHTVLAPSTELRWLADIIPIPCLPGRGGSDPRPVRCRKCWGPATHRRGRDGGGSRHGYRFASATDPTQLA
jgi:hypothetical protein